MQVYVDDIVITTKSGATLLDDLRETFDNLDRYHIKLNPKKCAFGGAGLDELYITSATKSLRRAGKPLQPHDGGLMRIRPGVRGQAPNIYG